MPDVTSIKVKKQTRDRLADFGKKAETYDEILTKLMDFYESSNRKKREGLNDHANPLTHRQ